MRTGSLDCRWSRESLHGPLGASSLGSVGAAGAGTPADAVDTASLGGGDFGLLQQGGQGDMLESRRATPQRLACAASRYLRSSTSGQLPSSGPIAYLPPLARSFSHLWWSSHLFPRRFFSVRTSTTTTPSSQGAPAPPRTTTRRQDLRLAPSVRAAGPEPFFRKTGVTGPRGGLVPPPSIASLHHQHACASFTDAWVLLRQQCLDRRRCDTPHPPAVERHVCHRVGAYQPNRSEDDH
jgi:hypothetical protein